MNAKLIIRRARVLTIFLAAAGALYLGTRFDLVTLPGDGCSPVSSVKPGARLLVDRWVSNAAPGDVVFVSDDASAVHLAILGPGEREGSWVVRGDVQDCPLRISDGSRAVTSDQLLGRVILNMGL